MRPSQVVALFLQDCELRGLKPHTIDLYRWTLDAFTRHFDGAFAVLQPAVIPFFATLSDKAPLTRRLHAKNLRAFLRWSHEYGYAPEVKVPAMRPQGPPRIDSLSADDIRRVVEGEDASDGFVAARNAAWLVFMFDTGCRVGEALAVADGDVEWKHGLVRLRVTKFNRPRTVPLGEAAGKRLWRYWLRRENVARCDALWVDRVGRPWTVRSAQKACRTLSAKYERSFTPHTLRHSFALAYIRNGGDPFSLQKILGHTSQDMTQHYVNMARDDISRQHRRFSPGDRL